MDISHLIDQLNGETAEERLDALREIKKLTDEYDVSTERCRADMLPFLEKLLERGLLVEG